MSKYTYDNYVLTVDFKNQFEMAITASDLFSGQVYINQNAVLEKIKKDTVVAALTKKNQKCLSCKFNTVDVEPKKLIVAFEVSFDFLPTFTQYVSLDQIQKKGNGLNKVESAELRSDIEELQKMLENLNSKDTYLTSQNTFSFTQKGEMYNKPIQKGNYLFQSTGNYVCSTGTKHDIIFTIETNDQTYQIQTCLYTNGGYGYLYSIRKQLNISQKSDLKLSVRHKNGQSFQFYHNLITLTPMVKIK